MRYRVRGMLIRSENAAKPMVDTARALAEWLRHRPRTHSALDYGCGKLRYTAYLAARSKDLGIADSSTQLDRIQRIGERMTTVRQHALLRWPACRIYDLVQFWQGIPHAYDFILCANVLSAIPCPKTRGHSLRAIRRTLTPSGMLLVANQHTNSYFLKARERPGAFPHLNGWVLPTRNGAAYYGILTRDLTTQILRRYGFAVVDAWIDGQSNYVLACRGRL